MFYLPFPAKKTECISFKSGYVVFVAQLLKVGWFIVLHYQLLTMCLKCLNSAGFLDGRTSILVNLLNCSLVTTYIFIMLIFTNFSFWTFG